MSTCRRIALPEFGDHRGRLMVAEGERHVPFAVARIFAIYDVPGGMSRGAHAHRSQQQFILMLAGSCVIAIEDEAGMSEERLNAPTEGLHVPPGAWIELKDFSRGAVCLVLASGHFDEADYIRDHAEFTRVVAARRAASAGSGTTL